MAVSKLPTCAVDKSTRTSVPTSATRTTAKGSIMKIEEQTTPVSTYEIHTPKLYVAVYYYKNSQTPFAFTSDTKESLIQSMKNFSSSTSFDETRPVKIFTLNC